MCLGGGKFSLAGFGGVGGGGGGGGVGGMVVLVLEGFVIKFSLVDVLFVVVFLLWLMGVIKYV